MKFKSTFFTVALLLLFLQFAHAQTSESEQTKLRGFSMSYTFQRDGNEYNYRLATDDVKNTPSWSPLNDDPPLSMQNAVIIARDSLKRFVKNSDDWKVNSITLKEVDTQKWIYDIGFACLKQECIKKFDTSFSLWIKMDGSIVEPEIKKKEKQNVR
jgi:hypothetical protein